MISESNILARLLAKENISVQYGNYQTAFFDVEKRVLGLPLWKDRGKDVHTLLVGHEVGHALYTPADGWHSSTTEIPGIPRSYINVVEDVRIEKLVQRTYPGLVSSFKRGYKVLNDEDFFKIAERSLSSYSVVDRINIKAKLRDLVDVEFTELESPVVEQVMAVETWEDVIEACRALYDFMKEQQDEQDTPSDAPSDSLDDRNDFLSTSNSETDYSSSEDSDSTESDTEENEAGERLVSSETSDSEEAGENKPQVEQIESDSDIDTVETDKAFRDNEKHLIETDEFGNQDLYSSGFNRTQVEQCITKYADLKDLRPAPSDVDGLQTEEEKSIVDLFEQETKAVVTVMAREFEMRKAAYRLQRSQTSRSGSINVDKLHSYKYNDDIFRRVTHLADAKSHGMVMFVDYSGSMSNVLGKVIRQSITLSDFCSKVNIPFAVYGFTSAERSPAGEFPGHVSERNCNIFELISSDLSRSDQKEARDVLLKQSARLDGSWRCPWMSSLENLGCTPLFETILCAEYIIKDFKAKYGVQKMNAIFLTDGDGDSLYTYSNNYSDKSIDGRIKASSISIKMNNKLVKSRNRYDMGPSLLNGLKTIPGVSVIGFFVCNDMYQFRGQLYKVANSRNEIYSEEAANQARKNYNSNKFHAVDNA